MFKKKLHLIILKCFVIKKLNHNIRDHNSLTSQFQYEPQEIFAQIDPIIFPNV